MKTSIVFLALLAVAAESKRWSFDQDTVGKSPTGFTAARTGQGGEGQWVVEAAADAPSKGQAVKQASSDATSYRFPVLVASAPQVVDGAVSVKFKAISGKVDQAGGLVFRYKDSNNYYVTRANALENNVRLYYVKDGSRKQFAGWDGKVSASEWHELRATFKGNAFEIYFDGTRVIQATDGTFKDAGLVGLWTKADSVTLFDDLVLQP